MFYDRACKPVNSFLVRATTIERIKLICRFPLEPIELLGSKFEEISLSERNL